MQESLQEVVSWLVRLASRKKSKSCMSQYVSARFFVGFARPIFAGSVCPVYYSIRPDAIIVPCQERCQEVSILWTALWTRSCSRLLVAGCRLRAEAYAGHMPEYGREST